MQLELLVSLLILSCTLKTDSYEDEKACYSAVGRPRRHDFPVGFSDCQKLHLLKKKLLRMSLILESCIETSISIKALFEQAEAAKPSAKSNLGVGSITLLADLEVYSTRLQLHMRTISSMTNRLSSTEKLVSYAFVPGIAA